MDDKTEKGMPRGFNFVEALQRKNRLNRLYKLRFCPAGYIRFNRFFFSGNKHLPAGYRIFLAGAHFYSQPPCP